MLGQTDRHNHRSQRITHHGYRSFGSVKSEMSRAGKRCAGIDQTRLSKSTSLRSVRLRFSGNRILLLHLRGVNGKLHLVVFSNAMAVDRFLAFVKLTTE